MKKFKYVVVKYSIDTIIIAAQAARLYEAKEIAARLGNGYRAGNMELEERMQRDRREHRHTNIKLIDLT